VAATKKDLHLRKRAAAAAFTLLGIPPAAQAAEKAGVDRWSIDTSFLQYSEAERITVYEPQVGVRRDFGGDRSLSILATVDTISGSSPSGILPPTNNTVAQTTTSPSGRAINPVIGKVPTTSYTDTRVALAGTWQQPVGDAKTGLYGASVSNEKDYLSVGANTSLARDFNEKNTTLLIGIAPEFDVSSPTGGLPVAFSTQTAPGSIQGTRDYKWLASGLVGVTQVINRRTLMQWNYTFTYENGYLNDPYKLLSVVNAGGDPQFAVYEQRPRSRMEHSLYWLTKYNIRRNDVFGLGLRYYGDDWGIRSQTLDFTYRWQYHERRYLEPHVRYYHQTKADFFHIGLRNTQLLPTFASADYRLADLDGVTFGVRWGWTLRNGSELILRAEYYTQTGDSHPSEAVGIQRDYDLFPTIYATILQIEYKFSL
jgi:hypothetical protein